jgi:hypothetical protein
MPWGGLIAAGGSILGGVLANRSAGDARDLTEQQLAFQRDAFNKQFAAATDPVVDIRGNRTTYVPGVGWQTTSTPQTARLINASDTENYNRLTNDASLARTGRLANALSRRNEGNAAAGILPTLQASPFGTSPKSMVDASYRAKAHGIKQGYEGPENATITQALRGGATSSNVGNIMSKFAQREAGDLGAASDAALSEGNNNWQNLTSNYRAGQGNLYNVLASRASNFDDVPFQPTSIPTEALSEQQSRQQGLNALPYSAANVRGATSSAYDSILNQGNTLASLFNNAGIAGAGLYKSLSRRGLGSTTTTSARGDIPPENV